MDVDEVSHNFEDQNLISYDRQEKNDRQNFIDMLKNKLSNPNANSIADLKNLSWKMGKKYMLFTSTIIYKENFLKIKENQDHHLKNLRENYIYFIDEELGSNLKNNEMIKLLKGKFGIEVSENTIRRALQEHEYYSIGLKIYQKYLERAPKKIRSV